MMTNNLNLSIHQLVEIQVSKTPDHIAVIFEDQQLTYQELNQKANQFAHHLQTLGVKPEVLVGIYVERSLEMLIALLGVLKAGGAYVPLDPAYPTERIAFMLEDSQLGIIVTQQSLQQNIPPHSAQVICWERDWEAIALHSGENLATEVTPDNLAYTMYTSGSTGNPKGVQIIHKAVVNLLLSMKEEPGLTENDLLIAVATISFDISVFELFLPLIVGAQIIIVSQTVATDPIKLSKAIAQIRPTVMQATPATWRMLLAVNWPGDRNLKILCGGEALTRNLANQLLERSSSLWNLYGPTETTVYSTLQKIEPGDSPISVGKPILNTQVYIIKYPARRKNELLKCVTGDDEGELYIGGIGLARGYLNRPELTEEKFVDDCFNEDPNARLYRTGDLARYLPDGSVMIIGRNDYQVKIRGYRIELGDIETACLQHPAIREIIVVVRKDPQGDNRLIAYAVLRSASSKITSAEIRASLRDKLPDYMIPSLVVFMDAFPLTPNFKVDRRALPVPTLNVAEEIVAPRTEIEKKLTEIWREILEIEVGIYQDFFESGGNSIRSAILIHQISETFQIELSLEALFKSPTIAALANVIEVLQSSGSIHAFETTADELWADAVLDATIRPILLPRLKPKNIFLTGATGFIGAFLLYELLINNPQANVYCLIRSEHLEGSISRLRRTMKSYEIWDDNFSSRIIPLIGDLSQPLFGLSVLQFQELADLIDIIYHSGAYVNLVYPYMALRDVNVKGTQEVLRLATFTKITPVHYISTLDVFQSSRYDGMEYMLETDDLASSEGYSDGYAQSKWAAEKLVMAARNRGLPACIYRLGMVTGHSQTGAFQLNNMICRLIKGLIQLGYAPELDINMTLAPVDYVTEAIQYLSLEPESNNKTFHLFNHHVLSMKELVSNLKDMGHEITSIPYSQWQAKLLDMSPDNALTPMASLFVKKQPHSQKTFIETNSFTSQTFDDRNTQEGLKKTNIVCRPIDNSVLKAYLSYFDRRGFLTNKTLSLLPISPEVNLEK